MKHEKIHTFILLFWQFGILIMDICYENKWIEQ